MMIRSLNVLSAVLGVDSNDITRLVEWQLDEKKRRRCYDSFLKRKSNGKTREITPSLDELKDLQNRLMSRVFRRVIFPYHITGSTRSRSGAINAKMHSGKKFHLQTDLTNFFGFVSNKQVYLSLCGLGFSADVASVLTKLTTYKGHLPQGAPTSPFLANLAGLMLDGPVIQFCTSMNITFTRYVDDLTFSADYDFQSGVRALLDMIGHSGYVYSHPKTVYKAGSVQVTGARATCRGVIGTTAQISKLTSPLIGLGTQAGVMSYLRYVEKVRAKFSLPKYRKEFSSLKHPESIWPYKFPDRLLKQSLPAHSL